MIAKSRVCDRVDRWTKWFSNNLGLLSALVWLFFAQVVAVGVSTSGWRDLLKLERLIPLLCWLVLSIILYCSRRARTDAGICLIAWRDAYENEVPLVESLLRASRAWEFVKCGLPHSHDDRSEWLDSRSHIITRVGDNAEAAFLGKSRLSVAISTRDHVAFLIGWKAFPRLGPLSLDIWGKDRFTGKTTAPFSRTLRLDSSHRLEALMLEPPQAGLAPDSVMHVISPRRVPEKWWPALGEPTPQEVRRFVSEGSTGSCALLVEEGDIRSLVICAATIRACILSSSTGEPDAIPPKIRLNCGEAIAFALGVLVANSGPVTIEAFEGQEWSAWWTVRV